MADPFGDADGAAGAANDDYSNAGWARISLGTTIYISDEFGHHCNSTISKMRRESCGVKTIVRFGLSFFLKWGAVQVSVQIESELRWANPKTPLYNDLHFVFFTAVEEGTAPIVCVDIYECSVKVAFVDGRKGQRNKPC